MVVLANSKAIVKPRENTKFVVTVIQIVDSGQRGCRCCELHITTDTGGGGVIYDTMAAGGVFGSAADAAIVDRGSKRGRCMTGHLAHNKVSRVL